jgi:hypothetical protein
MAPISLTADVPISMAITRRKYQNSGSSRTDVGRHCWPVPHRTAYGDERLAVINLRCSISLVPNGRHITR